MEPLLAASAAHRPVRGISGPGAALVAVGALAVGVVLGRHTTPALLGRTELLSLAAASRGPGLSGLAQSRAMQQQAEAAAVRDLDADRFPGETDDYLFQRIGAPLSASASGTYNPYLEGPYFPPSIKNYPFHDFYIPVSEESTADEVFSLPPLPYPYESLEPNIDRWLLQIAHLQARVHTGATPRTHLRNSHARSATDTPCICITTSTLTRTARTSTPLSPQTPSSRTTSSVFRPLLSLAPTWPFATTPAGST